MAVKTRAIALGFFDGVHIGHSALMRKVLEVGDKKGLVPSVITFDAHPKSLIRGETVPLINSQGDRAGIIRRLFGIDDIIFLHFDMETARMTWESFIEHLAVDFGARHLVAGHDFSFGYGGEGNSALLLQKCGEMGIGCDIIPAVKLDGVISSATHIRELISAGSIERANAFLGHPHVLTDMVRYGYRLGSTLGTPTVNMCFEPGVLIPAFGVYATKAFLGVDREFVGVTNVGVRPTVDDADTVTAETHVLNYRGNLYGHRVRVEFHARLRPEVKFRSMEELKVQIQKDCDAAQQYFLQSRGYPWA